MFTDKYCSLELCKEYCGNLEGTNENFFIDALILAASRAVELHTNVYWGPSATITEEQVENLQGRWDSIFYTRWAPIISVTTIFDDINDSDSPYASTDYVVFLEKGQVQRRQLRNINERLGFSKTPGQLKITYEVGQGSNMTEDYLKGVSAPADIQAATAMIAGDLYKTREIEGVAAKSHKDDSISYFEPDDIHIPRRAKALLSNRIRRVF